MDGDGVVSDNDRTYIGNALPKAEFGWTNNFTWKNWDFSFFLRGTIGNKVLNNPLAAYGTPNYITGTNAMKNDNLYIRAKVFMTPQDNKKPTLFAWTQPVVND